MAKTTVEQIRTLISYLPEKTEEQKAAKNEFTQKLEAIKPDEVSYYDDYGRPVLKTSVLTLNITKALNSDFEKNRTIIREHLRQLDVQHQARELLMSFDKLTFNPMRAKRFEQFAQFLKSENRDFRILKKVYDENSQDLSQHVIEKKLPDPSNAKAIIGLGVVMLEALAFLATMALITSMLGAGSIPAIPALLIVAGFVAFSLSILALGLGLMGVSEIIFNKVFPSPVAEYEDASVILPSGNNKCNRASFWSKTQEYKSMMAFEPAPQESTSSSCQFTPSLSAP